MKFKVGDTVTLIKDSDFYGLCSGDQIISGYPAKIVKVLDSRPNRRFKYLVEFRGFKQSYGDEDLEVFKIKATRLSKKLYPKYKEIDGWLYPW